jgi:hypothetical protein
MVAVVDSLLFSLNFKVAMSAAPKAPRAQAEDATTQAFLNSGLYTANQAISVHQIDLIPKIMLCALNSCH